MSKLPSSAALSIMRCALVAAAGVLFAAGAHLGGSRLIAGQNLNRLDEIGETVLRHAETAIDSADRLLGEVAREGLTDCGDASLQAIRLLVYQQGGIKDVRVASGDGAVRCSAYSETLEFDRTWPTRAEMLAVDGTPLRLFPVEQFAGNALGVFRDVGPGLALVAIVGIDPHQLDVIPGELRAGGQVSLALGDGQPLLRHASPGEASAGGAVLVERSLTRYPVRVATSIDPGRFASWNAAPVRPLAAGGGALGALFGLLLGRLLGRPADAAATLDQAIAAREFRPFYQPIFSLETRRVLGCEVLMRWAREGRILGPGAFIALAESTGRIEAMTWQVLEVALDELRPAMGADPAFKVSVNVVPRHLLSDGFAARLCRAVEAGRASPAQIVLEITERDELEDFERARAVIRDLRASGFRIAMDDVGVGHSGLSYIQRLRPDLLKIDKFFVDSIGHDGTADAVVAMLVRLGDELGMGVVAEGIETADQASALRACGVGQGQGYLVSPPMPAPAFLAFLKPPPELAAAA